MFSARPRLLITSLKVSFFDYQNGEKSIRMDLTFEPQYV